jgi:hypothetical protein
MADVPPFPARAEREDDGATDDERRWALIRERSAAVQFDGFDHVASAVLGEPPANAYEVLRTAAERFLMRGTGLTGVDIEASTPVSVELIWSYWHEEGMLSQAFAAIAERFQNRRPLGRDEDPLTRLDVEPLRPLSDLFWGWIQSEPSRPSARRRAYEYDHQYGLTVLGTSRGEVRRANQRSTFIAAYHDLLHLATVFLQEDDDITVVADGFPVLNALGATQLVLVDGQHNQFGDLPWTARVEMLVQQWILARPEVRAFLGGRTLVPYPEGWMDRIDTIRSMIGRSSTDVSQFRDLGVLGERLLLTIRDGGWSGDTDPESATRWVRFWRPEIQGYVHAYRAVTGVDLRRSADSTMPGILLRRRSQERAADDG